MEWISQIDNSFRQWPLLYLLGGPQQTEPHRFICVRGLSPSNVGSFVDDSVSECSQESRLVESRKTSCRIPVPFRALNSSSNFSMRVLELHPMFGCGYLLLFQSDAGWSLSEDRYAGLLFASTTEYH